MNEALRIPEAIIWTALLAITAPSLWRFYVGKNTRLDWLWLAMAFGTTNRLAFTYISQFQPDSDVARGASHVQAIMVGVLTFGAVLYIQRTEPK